MLSDGACQTRRSSLANERQHGTRKPRRRGHCSHQLDVCQQLVCSRARYVLSVYPFSVVFRRLVGYEISRRGWEWEWREARPGSNRGLEQREAVSNITTAN